MTVYELIDLAVSVNGRLDLQLSLFVTIHLALFGGIIYVDRPLIRSEKVGVLAIYTVFAALSFAMMLHQSSLVAALYEDIARMASDACCVNLRSVEAISSEVRTGRGAITAAVIIAVHICFYLAVMTAVVFDRAAKLKSELGNK